MNRSIILLACTVLLPLTACRSDEGDDGLVGMLEFITDTEDHRSYVALADWDRARRSLGLERPRTDEEAVEQLVTLNFGVAGKPELIAAGFDATSLRDPDEWRQAYGFTVRNVDRSFEAGVPPGRLLGTVLDDTAPIADAVRQDPLWSDELETVQYGPASYYAWGEEGRIDASRRSAPRPLGSGGRLLVLDDESVAIRAGTDQAIEEAIDAWKGDSLADDDDARALVEALDEAGMSSVYFTGQAPPFLPPGRSTAPSELAELPRLARFELAGGGHGLVDGEPVMIWAAVYRDGDTAAEAMALVRGQLEDGRSFVTNRPLREMVEVRSAETKGSLALITLAPRDDTSIGLLWRMMLARDFLYTSGS